MEEYLKSGTEKFLQLVGDIDVFIDCGVGIKGSEAWTINRLRPDCEIIGFEPEHRRFDELSKIFPGELIKLAIAENDGTIEGFMGHEKGKADFWLIAGENAPAGSYIKEEVKCTRLDTFINDRGLQDKKIAVWADIEGSELIMLRSCGIFLDSIVGFNLEMHPDHIQEQKSYTRQEVTDYLEQKNYIKYHNYGSDFAFINRKYQ